MRVVVVGPPASGKGTQAVRVAEHYRVPHLSTGVLLRAEVARGTDVGRAVATSMARGELVPDTVVIRSLRPHLVRARTGWVLDGFPRTRAQAEALDRHSDTVGGVDVVLSLDADTDELLRRMRRRAGEEGRADDTPEALNRRLVDFHTNAGAVISYYTGRGLLISIDASPPAEEVTRTILTALDRFAPVHPPGKESLW